MKKLLLLSVLCLSACNEKPAQWQRDVEAKTTKWGKDIAANFEQEPAAVEYYGPERKTYVLGQAPSAEDTMRKTRVRPGATVQELAEKFDVPSSVIIEMNNLKPPYIVKDGMHLKMPQPRFYHAKYGETIADVAERAGVDAELLAKMNVTKPGAKLMAGQRVQLPYAPYTSNDRVLLSGIFERFIDSDDYSRTVRTARARMSGMADSEENLAFNADGTPRSTPGLVKKGLKAEEVAEEELKAPEPKREVGSKKTKGQFIWPVKGTVLSRFGAHEGGVVNDGINISASKGASIKAAADGVVVYVGDDLPAYGNLLIIRHGGGWITAYAHADSISVKKGQKVKQGQAVAKAGETGHVTKPQVHFSLRKGSESLDPEKFL